MVVRVEIKGIRLGDGKKAVDDPQKLVFGAGLLGWRMIVNFHLIKENFIFVKFCI